MSNEIMLGAWTSFNFNINPSDVAVFETSLSGLVGVGYKPLAVATQVVAGVNYCFLCQAMPVYPDASSFAAKVYIYQPLQGEPHVTKIEHVAP
jgi:hypothetical protein